MLMPCNALPLPQETGTEPSSTKPKPKLKVKNLSNTSEDLETSDDDDEEQYWNQRVKCHHYHQSQEDSVVPLFPTGYDRTNQSEHPDDTQEHTMDTHELRADAEEFQVDIDNGRDNTERDISEPTETVSSPAQPRGVDIELPDTVLRRSQRDRRPRETLTYDALGQPVQRVIGLTANPLYANTVTPFYGQVGLPWIAPQMPYYPAYVPVGYY